MEFQNWMLRSRKKPSAICASLKVTVMEFAVMSVTVTSLGGRAGLHEREPSAVSEPTVEEEDRRQKHVRKAYTEASLPGHGTQKTNHS